MYEIMNRQPIITRHGEVSALARLMRVSPRTVHAALRGVTRSPLADRLRQMALKRGGALANADKAVKNSTNNL